MKRRMTSKIIMDLNYNEIQSKHCYWDKYNISLEGIFGSKRKSNKYLEIIPFNNEYHYIIR